MQNTLLSMEPRPINDFNSRRQAIVFQIKHDLGRCCCRCCCCRRRRRCLWLPKQNRFGWRWAKRSAQCRFKFIECAPLLVRWATKENFYELRVIRLSDALGIFGAISTKCLRHRKITAEREGMRGHAVYEREGERGSERVQIVRLERIEWNRVQNRVTSLPLTFAPATSLPAVADADSTSK